MEPKEREVEVVSAEKSLPKTGRYLNIRLSPNAVIFAVAFVLLTTGLFVTLKTRWYTSVVDKYNAASITLKVKEGDTLALKDALVSYEGKSIRSDEQGKVSLKDLKAGAVTVSFEKDGYEKKTVKVEVHRGENDLQIVSLTKLPDKTYSIKGYIQDYISDQPIVNVQVALGDKTVQTDPNGGYSFATLTPGEYKLVLSKAGYLNKELAVTLSKDDFISAKVPLVPSGQVNFVSNRDGNRGLYVSNYDGSGTRRFVEAGKNGGEDFAPSLAPNGKFTLFSSTREKVKDSYGNADLAKLYLVSQDGKEVKKVSDDLAYDAFSPLWSPNGQYAYYSAFTTPQMNQSIYHIYDVSKPALIDLGEAVTALAYSPNSSSVAYYISTSELAVPTGAPADSTPVTTYYNILKTYNLKTGERKQLAKKEQYMSELSYSADGKSVAYDAVGNNVRRRFSIDLTSNDNKETEVAVLPYAKRQYILSPDGTKKAFVEARDGKTNVFVVDSSDQNEKRLTTLGVVSTSYPLQWDSTGRYVTFAVHREAEDALYVTSLAGGDPKKITDYYAERKGYGG